MSRQMALSLVIGSGFLHALWNWLANHFGPKDSDPNKSGRVSVYRVYLWSVPPALLFTAVNNSWPKWSMDWVWGELLACVGIVLYVLALQGAYRLASLGPVYGLSRASAALVGIPVAAVMIGEKWHWVGALGALVAIVSMVFLKPPESGLGKATRLALMTGLAIAAYNTGFKVALSGGLEPIGAQLLTMILPAILSVFLLLRNGEPLFAPLDLAAGLISWVSFFLFLTGMTVLGAGESILLRNISLIFAEVMDQLGRKSFEPKRMALTFLLFLALVMVAWKP